MDYQQLHQHKLNNTLQSVLLIASMAILLGVVGGLFAGPVGVWLALTVCALLLAFGPQLSPRFVLSLYRAQPIDRRQAPDLHMLTTELSRRAGLARTPQLYYIPSRMMNAFAVGSRDDAAIGLTDGLLRRLPMRELAGVLAHEISHVKHNDMWVMNLADVISRITIVLSQAGLFLLLFSIPLLLLGMADISLLAILLLIFAPTLTTLLQLALSRAREFDADLGAVQLTGDPAGLAAALRQLEQYQGSWLEQIFMPGRRIPEPAWLRTHPPLAERIERLRTLSTGYKVQELPLGTLQWPDQTGRSADRPRWHWHGLWY